MITDSTGRYEGSCSLTMKSIPFHKMVFSCSSCKSQLVIFLLFLTVSARTSVRCHFLDSRAPYTIVTAIDTSYYRNFLCGDLS